MNNQISSNVEHIGIVRKKTRDNIIIGLVSFPSCGGCSVRGLCSISELEQKNVEIINSGQNVKIGEKVNVVMQRSLGFKALFLAYVLPFFILIIILILVFSITHNEGISGLISVGILLPYYLSLYFFREKIKRSFSFEIKGFE